MTKTNSAGGSNEAKEKARAYHRVWRAANPDKVRASRAKKDKATEAAYQREYRAKNRAQLDEKRRSWYQDNKGEIAAKRLIYKLANRDKIKAASKKYYWDTKETRKEAMRANALKQNRKRPALLLARQEAALGRKKPDICDACGGSDGGIVFDHCHSAMFPRGWLCDRCNIALGCLRDDIDRLRKLIGYLKRNKTGVTPDFMIAGKFASRYRGSGSRRHVVVEDENGHSLTRIG